MRFLVLAFAFAALSVAAVACGGSNSNATTTPTTAASTSATPTTAASAAATATAAGATATVAPSAEAGTVDVKLQDYSITANQESVPAGTYKFAVTNNGPSVHEFVLVKTDLDAANLPTLENGSVNESSSQLQAIDSVKNVAVNGNGGFTTDLAPGHYVFFCNIVENSGGTTIVHYAFGMRGNFTVQ